MGKIKLTLIILLSFLALTGSAHRKMRRSSYDGMLRTGFHIGVTGSLNSTWILNQNNYNTLNLFYIPIVRQSELDYNFTWGGQVGLNLGYNFIKRFGLEFEPSFSWAGQTYDDNFVGPVAALYQSSVTVNGANGPVVIHATPDGFVPDPQYQQGVKNGQPYFPYYSGSYRYINVRREIKFNYVQFPLYAKYQTHVGEIASYYLMLGPQVNFRQSGSEAISVNYHPYSYAGELTPDQRFSKLDVGITLKTGVDIYAKDWCYFNVGIVSFIALNDLNGANLKEIGWYSKNDVSYQPSHSFYLGLQAGFHFYIDRKHYY